MKYVLFISLGRYTNIENGNHESDSFEKEASTSIVNCILYTKLHTSWFQITLKKNNHWSVMKKDITNNGWSMSIVEKFKIS